MNHFSTLRQDPAKRMHHEIGYSESSACTTMREVKIGEGNLAPDVTDVGWGWSWLDRRFISV